MRKPEEIRKEIEALNKELAEAKTYEAKRDAAVHILENLGWTHSGLKGWQKPAPKAERLAQYPTEGGRTGDLGGRAHWWYSLYPQCRRQVCSGVTCSRYQPDWC